MNSNHTALAGIVFGSIAAFVTTTLAYADTFGTGPNQFTIPFVPIGNRGNPNDTVNTIGRNFGGVAYDYRMGVTEVPQDWITKATSLGLANVTAGPWSAQRPAGNVSWYEAAAFVNWLNTSTGHVAAYDLRWTGTAWTMNLWSPGDTWTLGGQNAYRNKEAYYFLPSESEWYKAAFYDPNKAGGAGYWLFATGSDTLPAAVASGTAGGTVVYNAVGSQPATVNNAGGLSPYGTRGQTGNVWDWQESEFDGLNDNPSNSRVVRGGNYANPYFNLYSSVSATESPDSSYDFVGFRVASIPEPAAAGLLLIGLGTALMGRRRIFARAK